MLVYWIWLSQLPELSMRHKAMLLQRFSDPEDLYHAEPEALSGIEPQTAKALANKDLTEAKRILGKCTQKGIDILTYNDAQYPSRLRNIPDPPIVLYCKGHVPDLNSRPAIGVVGTRKATPYGIAATRKLSRQIACCGGIVVSGGASGIDSAAMRGALEVEQPVICVLGCGVDVVYPKSNRQLFADTVRNGCLLSEYPPGDQPERWHFPQRNRIISGIANGVLVTEAPEISGALITARQALEQGRDVYTVPGNIDVATNAGSNALLQDGAAVVFSGWDIMQEYAAQYPDTVGNRPVPARDDERPNDIQMVAQPSQAPISGASDKKDIDKKPANSYIGIENPSSDLTAEEQSLLDTLSIQPQPVDDVIAQADLPAARVLSILTKLALKGLVINHPGRRVSASNRRK